MSIILASGSRARRTMLENAGLQFQVCPADIDEAEILHRLQQKNAAPEEIAQILAQEKAASVSRENRDILVIGGDQILTLNDQIFTKAPDKNAALEKLKTLRGKTHYLVSAICVCRDGEVLWQHVDRSILTMHDFDDAFLEAYAERAGDALTRAVGAYELEAAGSWLFEKVEGDFFTVLGMPLLPLLKYLREEQGAPL